MKKELIHLTEIKLVGFAVRTNNKNEMDPATSKIAQLFKHFWNQDIAKQISNRKNPGVTFSVYTEYESNEQGDYTYFIGEEVNSFAQNRFNQLTIAAARYQKFTTESGAMPEVVIHAWQQIWQMSAAALGGERAYLADFERYDQRALDSAQTSLDIYIGVK